MSEKAGSIRDLVRLHRRVAIDSNVLIYLLDGDPGRAETAAVLVDAVATGQFEGVLASIGLAEALVGPARAGDGAAFEQAAATIRDLGFRIAPMDAGAAEDTAWIRGRTGMSLPDAAHIACARAAGATAFVTNDLGIGTQPGLEVVHFDDLEVGEPLP
ncbi:MAG: type II toxin-antitoxin system VapC family toxin [Candidatus Limnocylindrales bacterium]